MEKIIRNIFIFFKRSFVSGVRKLFPLAMQRMMIETHSQDGVRYASDFIFKYNNSNNLNELNSCFLYCVVSMDAFNGGQWRSIVVNGDQRQCLMAIGGYRRLSKVIDGNWRLSMMVLDDYHRLSTIVNDGEMILGGHKLFIVGDINGKIINSTQIGAKQKKNSTGVVLSWQWCRQLMGLDHFLQVWYWSLVIF